MAGPLEIVFDTPTARIVVTDSLTYCDDRITTADCVVGGSFIGAYPAALALRAGARAIIGHAAGDGRDHAGIAGLHLADRWAVPCAAVDSDSARLADGPDTWHSGRLSHVNPAAESIGVGAGMSTAEAARLMLASAPGQKGRAAEWVQAEREIVWRGPEGSVFGMPSVGLATAECAGGVICAGSHAGLVTWRYVAAYRFPIAGVICNDASVGKDQAGIAGIEPLEDSGMAAAAVSYRSARIGDGRSTFADGVISHLNGVAEAAGVRSGQPARDAALAMLRAYSARRGRSDG